MTEPRFIQMPAKKLVGKKIKMSLAADRTYELWRSFMPERKLVKNAVSTDLFSVQVFEKDFNFNDFNPDAQFEKWAALEVNDIEDLPAGMESLLLDGGLYVVFDFKGPSSQGEMIFRYIFGAWLPASGYIIDNRPHFEVLGEKYKNNDPASEEEIWIPVKRKE